MIVAYVIVAGVFSVVTFMLILYALWPARIAPRLIHSVSKDYA